MYPSIHCLYLLLQSVTGSWCLVGEVGDTLDWLQVRHIETAREKGNVSRFEFCLCGLNCLSYSVPHLVFSPVSAPFRLYLERQKNKFFIHSVACTGTEVHLAVCPMEFSKPNATSTCTGGMPAVVSCMPGPQFLQNSSLKKKVKISVKSS